MSENIIYLIFSVLIATVLSSLSIYFGLSTVTSIIIGALFIVAFWIGTYLIKNTKSKKVN